jgi:hypothetical protein
MDSVLDILRIGLPTLALLLGAIFLFFSVATYEKIKQTRPERKRSARIGWGFISLSILSLIISYLIPALSGIQSAPITTPTLTSTVPSDTPVPPTTTPAPTLTNTPVTPTVTLTPTVTPLTIYDDFENHEFDSRYDPTLWKPDTSNGTISQNDGILTIQKTKGRIIGLQATNYREVGIRGTTVFEAQLMISQEQSGHLFMEVISYPSGVVIDCTAKPSDEVVEVGCGYGDKNSVPIENYHELVIAYNTWHTVRIEIEPETMTIAYYADGEELKRFVAPAAEKLKTNNDNFTFEIGYFNDNTSDPAGVGYVNDVRIEETH